MSILSSSNTIPPSAPAPLGRELGLFIHGIAVVSQDGFIAKRKEEPPALWSSPEDFIFLQTQLALGGACVMGRTTHEQNPNKKGRQRVVFTSQVSEPRLLNEQTLLCNPEGARPEEVLKICAAHAGSNRIVVLGGTRVYDYFRRQVGYDQFDLTIESRIRFGSGLPLFQTDASTSPADIMVALAEQGLCAQSTRELNANGAVLSPFRLPPRPLV